jgi:hypothetical protein
LIITRRSVLASLGLAMPVAAIARGAQASTTPSRAHHDRTHAHSAHLQHHGKPHRTASAAHHHPKRA